MTKEFTKETIEDAIKFKSLIDLHEFTDTTEEEVDQFVRIHVSNMQANGVTSPTALEPKIMEVVNNEVETNDTAIYAYSYLFGYNVGTDMSNVTDFGRKKIFMNCMIKYWIDTHSLANTRTELVPLRPFVRFDETDLFNPN